MKTNRTGRKARTLLQWNRLGQRELGRILAATARIAAGMPALRRGGPIHPQGVAFACVGEAKMKRLNARYRGKGYATDVLSFPTPEPLRRLGFLGELVICVPVLKRQARRLELAEEAELRILLVHGLLHLLGYDHEKGGRAAAEMRRMEKRLLGACGWLGAPGLIQRSQSGKNA